MPDCSYCGESFETEGAYLDHLADAHDGELSRIDRRRIEQATAEDDRSRLVVYGAIAVVVLLLAAGIYVTTLSDGDESTSIETRSLPENGDQSLLEDVERFPSQGRSHVSPGTGIDYATSPPTSGPHYGDWTDAGYYEETPAAGYLVHSLEHGAVVIYYDPDALTPEAEESLRAFAGAHQDQWASVVVAPNPNDDPESPYVLTAWRTMLRMDEYDPEVVRAFLAEYLGRGPENPVR